MLKQQEHNNEPSERLCSAGECRLVTITPLAKQINCLDVKRIGDLCVTEIPQLIGAKLASLYILDETSDILHLEKNNHPFLINNIVSLNQNPPSPMVAAIRSKELLVVEGEESLRGRRSAIRFVSFRATIRRATALLPLWFVMDVL